MNTTLPGLEVIEKKQESENHTGLKRMPSPLKRSSTLKSPLRNKKDIKDSPKESHDEDFINRLLKKKKAIKVIDDDSYKVDANKDRKSISKKVQKKHCKNIKLKAGSSSELDNNLSTRPVELDRIIFRSLDRHSKLKRAETGRNSANKSQTKTLKSKSVKSSKDKDTSENGLKKGFILSLDKKLTFFFANVIFIHII